MSKKQTKQSRKTAKRKARQRIERKAHARRRYATQFEGVSERRAARMSPEALDQLYKTGKRRKFYPAPMPLIVDSGDMGLARAAVLALTNDVLRQSLQTMPIEIFMPPWPSKK